MEEPKGHVYEYELSDEALDQQGFICSICLMVLESPVDAGPCGCTFCEVFFSPVLLWRLLSSLFFFLAMHRSADGEKLSSVSHHHRPAQSQQPHRVESSDEAQGQMLGM
jgi:hypothetical protein